MAEIISMPQLSDTMEEGIVVKWNKKIGEIVSEGDILAEIETDKAIQDFEVDVSGYLLFIGAKEGEKTRVNDILAIIGDKNEDISHLIIKKNDQVINQEENKEKNRIFISPLAKKMAKKIGLSIDKIRGSGDKGRIVKKDIDIHKNEKNVEISSMRKKIAEHLTYSKFTAPHYYLFIEINVGKMIQLRQEINEKLSKEDKISFNDIIIKAVALSLKKNPHINSSWKEEKIVYHSHINIGVAVSVKEGLIVPVIYQTDQKSLLQISKEIKDKALRSKLKKIKEKEIENSTFTVSNLGMYGIEFFTSIINIPNSSILSIGSILEKPIVIDSKIKIGKVMKLTLSCDHRIIDGSTGSNFLHSLKEILEDPVFILI
ncbi:dihydrolipoamide acetyltransferase family protein [Blattabacterium cuenoti]|uniref:dihydrolipoamide acetyltransferase family protein n=1 Tax=Blattabacterium cuenoti TaxID=1653831 RepID=UPI00163C8668|nr:dihydrolipoamide acetyltransferase family protein [Blattabacterium cuenoti]